MSASNTCDKCKQYNQHSIHDKHGSCALIADINDVGERALSTDKAYAWDYEGYRAGTYVGIKFGCIHWEKKNET